MWVFSFQNIEWVLRSLTKQEDKCSEHCATDFMIKYFIDHTEASCFPGA